MVKLLDDFPPYVAAYKASGAVSKEEYEEVVMNRVNQVASVYGKINFLVLLETDMDNYSIGAFFKYLQVSFKHFSKWKRMAIVSDERWLRRAYEIFSFLVPSEIKGFTLMEFEAARKWVSESI